MKLDSTFERTLRKLTFGDGSGEYKFKFIENLERVSNELANRYAFGNCIEKYGREKVALCVAATIINIPDRFERRQEEWARLVVAAWMNRTPGALLRTSVNLHPALLADNSSALRKMTLVE